MTHSTVVKCVQYNMGVSYCVYTRKPDFNTTHCEENCNCCQCCRASHLFVDEYISKQQTLRLYAIQGLTFGQHEFDHKQLKQVSDNLQRVLFWYQDKLNLLLLSCMENAIEQMDITDTEAVNNYMNLKAYPAPEDSDEEAYSLHLSQMTNSEVLDANVFEPVLSQLNKYKSEWMSIEPDINILTEHAKWYPWSYTQLFNLAKYIHNCYTHNLFLYVSW